MHIDKKADIASTVLIAGDPKRARWAAETLLTDPKLVSDVRGASVFTGTYKGNKVSFATSGMGQPSIAIYATELFQDHNVQTLVRVGTCGTYNNNIPVGSIVEAKSAWSENNIFEPKQTGWIEVKPKFELGIGTSAVVHCGDVFYREIPIDKEGLDVVDMESFALLYLGNKFNRHAHTILTVSDNLNDHSNDMDAIQRQTKTLEMYREVLQKVFA